MHRPPAPPPDAQVVPDAVAARLLARASELDAAFRSGASVAELRAVAAEAGISDRAFDAALAELGGEPRAPDVGARRRRPRGLQALAAGLVALIAVGALVLPRLVVPSSRAAPVAQEVFLLRCLTPAEAGELIRPVLGAGGMVTSSARAPRALTVRGTPAQLRDVRSVLDRYEEPGSAACAVRPAPAGGS